MPMVGNKKFAYTSTGKKLAAKYAQKVGADKPYRGAMAPSNPAGFPKRDAIVSRPQQTAVRRPQQMKRDVPAQRVKRPAPVDSGFKRQVPAGSQMKRPAADSGFANRLEKLKGMYQRKMLGRQNRAYR
jgi:hypothetical protein